VLVRAKIVVCKLLLPLSTLQTITQLLSRLLLLRLRRLCKTVSRRTHNHVHSLPLLLLFCTHLCLSAQAQHHPHQGLGGHLLLVTCVVRLTAPLLRLCKPQPSLHAVNRSCLVLQ
jgi:hypothetical protein